MRTIMERLSVGLCVIAGAITFFVPLWVWAPLLALGLSIAAYLDFTCQHQRRLYRTNKK